jgi:16S rRNA (cytosine967-C5)-methyltransferase
MVNIREVVLSILMEYDKGGVFKPSLLKDSLEKYDYLDVRDKAFIKRVVEGTMERQIQIDYILDQFSKTPVKKMQPLIRSLMRMSVYQILFMDAVPNSAACNEAVKLAERHSFTGLKGFVNGVLRNISRNRDKIKYPDESANGGLDYLSVYYSMPKWICSMWLDRFGMEKTKEMLEFFLKPRPTTIRVNMSKAMSIATIEDAGNSTETDHETAIDNAEADRVAALAKELEAAGTVVNKSPILPYALELEKTDNIRFLPGFEEGLFAVQDVSSMLVTEVAGPKPGDTVIDICSAPGGKATHAAERVMTQVAENEISSVAADVNTGAADGDISDSSGTTAAATNPGTTAAATDPGTTAVATTPGTTTATTTPGRVIARDLSERKCALISENAYRLGLDNIEVQVHDARLSDYTMRDKADILYMDLPCSGLGIIGRKSDIKYNTSEKSLKEVSKLQWEIIKAAWDYVKEGGYLIYSTCTVNSAENEDMLKRITEEMPFETVDITDSLPAPLVDGTFGEASAERLKAEAKEGYIQLLPGECGTDGFFISKLRRTAAEG